MSDDLLERLRGFEKAYPESVFVPPTREQRKRLHEKEPGLQDCIAADMARHLVERAITPAADEIESLRAEVSRLRAAIEEHRLCSQGWRDASETDKTLWAAKYEEVSDE